MDLGVIFPTHELDDPGAVRAFAAAAEQLGYRRLVIFDHVLGAVHANRTPPLWGPYDEHTAFHEPLTLLAYLAGVTRGLELATGVLILPQRQTALVAKQAVELDLLSEGRFVLGVGTGWNYVEYESMGVPWADRGARFDEQLRVLRELWSSGVVDIEAEFHRIDRAGLCPLPSRRISLWFGGHTERAYGRAIRWGDGFTVRTAGEERRRTVDRLRELLAQRGRPEESFDIEAIVDFHSGPESWIKDREELEGIGASIMTVRSSSVGAAWRGSDATGPSTVDGHIAAIERFRDELGLGES